MVPKFTARHRVEFFETDLAGIVHFANFYRFMEQAEHAFFRSLGLKIHGNFPDGTAFGWPRVSATCSFKSPAYYEDELDISVTVVRVTRRSLTTSYEFRRGDLLLAVGEMKTAYCIIPAGAKLQSVELPDEIYEKLNQSSGDSTVGDTITV
ncbi:acyl-CoA thioesterase [Schlesneria sp.]|uniref:acyl-CoA thioesterase n=1 Tax=Schlesneria sp. TaxID=2762018 RepID=UPI002F035889